MCINKFFFGQFGNHKKYLPFPEIFRKVHKKAGKIRWNCRFLMAEQWCLGQPYSRSITKVRLIRLSRVLAKTTEVTKVGTTSCSMAMMAVSTAAGMAD